METYHYIIIGVALVILIGLSIYLFSRKKEVRKEYELSFILELIDKSNVIGIDFIRNKIVIKFKDVSLFDTDKLHEKGAKGISIVGDKVKFYFDGDNELNENIYKQVKKHIEG